MTGISFHTVIDRQNIPVVQAVLRVMGRVAKASAKIVRLLANPQCHFEHAKTVWSSVFSQSFRVCLPPKGGTTNASLMAVSPTPYKSNDSEACHSLFFSRKINNFFQFDIQFTEKCIELFIRAVGREQMGHNNHLAFFRAHRHVARHVGHCCGRHL